MGKNACAVWPQRSLVKKVSKKETIILLHGIGHNSWNMYAAQRNARKAGYEVINISYPSTKYDVQTLGVYLDVKMNNRRIWPNSKRVHFITHSMGGLVTQNYLHTHKDKIPQEKIGRIVMIAPPLGGSEIADFLKNVPPYRWVFGLAGIDLTTQKRAAVQMPPYYDLGIIAGSKHWPYFVARFMMKGDHDGRVTIESTKITGMKDHITLPATHSFISWKKSTHVQALHFIKDGHFNHGT